MAKKIDKVKSRDKSKEYDARYLGNEPEFDGVEFAAAEERNHVKMDAFNWYSYFKPNAVDYRAEIKTWLADDPERQSRVLKNLNLMGSTAGKLIRMSNRGWVLSPEEINFIETTFDDVEFKVAESDEVEAEAPKVVDRPPPPLAARSRLMIMLHDLEDTWIEGQPTGFDLKLRQEEAKDTKEMLREVVRPWIEHMIEDYTTYWDKEGYPNVTIKERNRRVTVLKDMLKDVDTLLNTGKKPRRKKPLTKAKQAKGFVCLAESTEFKVKSLPPVSIIGAERVFLFNEKYRTLTELVAHPGGFSGKGMEIINVDPKLSRTIKLRKPLDILPKVCNNALRTIHKEWGSLTTKSTEANPRLNRNTVILRVF